MARDPLLCFFRLRLRWLLALALLLPLAQAVTAAHAVSHAPESARQAGGEKAHLQHCPICTAAAVLGGNVLPGTPAHLALAPFVAPAPPSFAARPVAVPRPHLPPPRGPPRSFA